MSSGDHTWHDEYARKDADRDCTDLGAKVRNLTAQVNNMNALIAQLQTESNQAAFAAAEFHRRIAQLEKLIKNRGPA